MCLMIKTTIGKWLDQKYLEWQMQEGGSRGVGAFAQWLGVDRELLSRWMNGKSKPDKASANKIAIKLSDREIYKILGYPIPDQRLQTIFQQWETYSEEKKNELFERAIIDEDGSKANQADGVVAHVKRK